jgi:heme-degrading monooxygenase HmoA
MPYVLIHLRVADYAKWRPGFDANSATRREGGSQSGRIFRSASDPNELITFFEWDDLESARQFTQSADLREKMQQAGVIGRPDVYFLEEVERVPH